MKKWFVASVLAGLILVVAAKIAVEIMVLCSPQWRAHSLDVAAISGIVWFLLSVMAWVAVFRGVWGVDFNLAVLTTAITIVSILAGWNTSKHVWLVGAGFVQSLVCFALIGECFGRTVLLGESRKQRQSC